MASSLSPSHPKLAMRDSLSSILVHICSTSSLLAKIRLGFSAELPYCRFLEMRSSVTSTHTARIASSVSFCGMYFILEQVIVFTIENFLNCNLTHVSGASHSIE